MGIDDLVALTLVGGGISRIVDWVRTRFDKSNTLPKDWWIGLSVVLGVGFALIAKANLLAEAAWASSVGVMPGRVVTGVALGFAAGGSHELLDVLSSLSKMSRAKAALNSRS